MSRENVELVESLQPRPRADLAVLFREDERWAKIAAFFEARSHPGFESGFVRGADRVSHRGLDGFRQTWLDWLEPWESYRTEVVEMVPHGPHVVVLVHDYGRRHGMDVEVRLLGAAVWTVRDARLERAFFYTDREDALRDVDLPAAILDHE